MTIDLWWLFPGVVIAWYLSVNFFPDAYENLAPATYWLMGVFSVLGLLASLIFHELSHCLIAKRMGLSIQGASILLFGGITEMDCEPPTARSELLIALAGPLSNIALGIICYAAYLYSLGSGYPKPLSGLLAFGGIINGVIAGFNLLPAFPLDGGRIVRSLLWSKKKDMDSATEAASIIGAMCGIAFLPPGFVNLYAENFMWSLGCFTASLFLMSISRKTYHSISRTRTERYLLAEIEKYRKEFEGKRAV